MNLDVLTELYSIIKLAEEAQLIIDEKEEKENEEVVI